MLRGLEKVLNGETKKSGNYFYEYSKDLGTTEVFYHTTCICAYDDDLKIGFADNRGFHPMSTNRAVNDCKRWLESNGYVLVDVEDFKLRTSVECRVGGWA